MKTRSELGAQLITEWDEFEQLVYATADAATDGAVKVNSPAFLSDAMSAVQEAGILSLPHDEWIQPLSVRVRYLTREYPADAELVLAVDWLARTNARLREWLGGRAPASVEPWEPWGPL